MGYEIKFSTDEDQNDRWLLCIDPTGKNPEEIERVLKQHIEPAEGTEALWRDLWQSLKNGANICGTIKPVPIETQVEIQLGLEDSKLNMYRRKVGKIVEKTAGQFSLSMIASHNFKKLPPDGDSFVSSAVVLHSLMEETRAIKRKAVFTPDPLEIFDNNTLGIILLPMSDDNLGWIPEDRSVIESIQVEGGRALFVGDARFTPVGEFKRDGSFGFDTIVVNDHHKWPDDLAGAVNDLTDDNTILINNHLVFAGPNVDAYASGAFYADLLGDDKWYKFAKQLSLFCDKYHPLFPNTVKDLDEKKARDISEMVNLLGTYLASWKPEGAKNEFEVTLERRKVMIEITTAISSSEDFDSLNKKLIHISKTRFGVDFLNWYRQIMADVDQSIEEFRSSKDKVHFYKIKSADSTVVLIHKIAFAMLNATDGFGERVLVHYAVNEETGNMVVLLARDSDYTATDLSAVCRKGPDGIKWGGGHNDRAGFGTLLVQDKLKGFWQPEDGPDKILQFVLDNVVFNDAKQEIARTIPSISNANDLYAHYTVTDGARIMIEDFLLAGASPADENCFQAITTAETEEVRLKLAELLQKVQAECAPRKDPKLMATNSVARTIKIMQLFSPDMCYKLDEVNDAALYLDQILYAEGPNHKDTLRSRCRYDPILTLACVGRDDLGFCFKDDGDGYKMSRVDSKHILVENLFRPPAGQK